MEEKDTIICGNLYLDTDTDPKLNKGSDYMLNCVISNDGRYAVITNALGNNRKVNIIDISETVIIIGWCADDTRNRLIFFIYDTASFTDHIYYYDFISESFSNIASGIYFNWDGSLIDNAKVIGDLLYWTDNIAPRKINYVRAYNYTNSISTTYKYNSLSSLVIEASKRPPSPISSVVPVSGSNNILRAKSYQWALKYIYVDGERSVLSPFSDIYFTDTQYYVNGEYNNATGIINYLVNFTCFREDTKACELYVRNDEKSDWYLYDTINTPIRSFSGTVDISDTSQIRVSSDVYNQLEIGMQVLFGVDGIVTDKIISSGLYILQTNNVFADGTNTFSLTGYINYYFYDNKLKVAKDQKDLARPFDYVPILAGTQELIEKNRIIYADITEGFDNIQPNMSVSLVYNQITTLDDTSSGTSVGTIGAGHPFTYRLGWTSYNTNTLYVIILFRFNASGGAYVATIRASYVSVGTDELTILTALRDLLVSNGMPSATTVVGGSAGSRYIQYVETAAYIYNHYLLSYNTKSVYKTAKFGDSYLSGIQYYDKNFKLSSVHKNLESIDVPKYIDAEYPYTHYNTYVTATINIRHLPPNDAYYFSPMFSKRTKSGYYLQFAAIIKQDYSFGTDGYLKIKINNLINYTHDYNPLFNISTYVYEKGDRIRLIGTSTALAFPFVWTQPSASYRHDVEITGMQWPNTDAQYLKDEATSPAYITDANGNKVQSDYESYISVPLTSSQIPTATILFEIYRPLKEQENIYYYPQGFYEIGNPGLSNRYHKGTSQNQNPANSETVPAIITGINFGDTYLKLRDMKYIHTVTDDNYSDYYTSNFYGLGRPNIYDSEAKRVNLISGMRYSGRLLENTKINELNKFVYDDLVVLKSRYGAINKVIEAGDVLKVLQDRKETSIYVGKEEMDHPDGSVTLITSNKVLGSQNSYDEERGTLFPLGVVVHNRDMYYYDMLRGEVIRSSPNGQIAISEYGMKTYFKNLSNTLKATAYTDYSVCAGYDEENKIYYITINGATLGFYEPLNKWISFYSFVPRMYCSSGNYFGTINSEGFWKHNDTTVNRCTFYGEKYKQQVNWYSNINSIIKKLYRSITLKTNKAWSIPTISSEIDATYIRGVLSKLNSNHFILKEGKYYAGYLKNMYSTSNTASNLDLINGDDLRCFYLKHQAENLENGEVWIFEIEHEYDIQNPI